MTYCTGYLIHVYHRFIGSLYDTGFTGTTFMIVKSSDQSIIESLKSVYPRVVWIEDKMEQKSHLNIHRFLVMKEVLKTNLIQSDYVFLCDSRDVLFQKNFEHYPLDETVDLFGFLENKRSKMTQCLIHHGSDNWNDIYKFRFWIESQTMPLFVVEPRWEKPRQSLDISIKCVIIS